MEFGGNKHAERLKKSMTDLQRYALTYTIICTHTHTHTHTYTHHTHTQTHIHTTHTHTQTHTQTHTYTHHTHTHTHTHHTACYLKQQLFKCGVRGDRRTES